MLTILIYISFVIALLLVILNILIYSSLNKIFKIQNTPNADINISVIVAAKNESQNIPVLIHALKEQNYPKLNFEVIIVDDNSSDNTYQISNNLCENIDNFKTIVVNEKRFKGKRGALDYGISKAKFPYILITDADCEPERDWIISFANEFSTNKDFIFGIAPFKSTRNLTNLIARFENLRASIITFAFAELGYPYSASARSFGFSKVAFNKIKGYKNTTATLSGDDDLLLQEAIKNKLNIGLVTNNNAFVYSQTKMHIGDYINQKSRHTSTSIHYSFKSKLILAFWHFINLCAILFAFLFPFSVIFLFPIFIKFVLDLFVLNNYQNNFGYRINPIYFVGLQLQYEFSLAYFFIRGINFNDRWE